MRNWQLRLAEASLGRFITPLLIVALSHSMYHSRARDIPRISFDSVSCNCSSSRFLPFPSIPFSGQNTKRARVEKTVKKEEKLGDREEKRASACVDQRQRDRHAFCYLP